MAASAQVATTSLRGVIKDPSGATVSGATVTLEDKSSGQKLTATSKSSGEYQLLQIHPATYLVTVTASGFGSQSKVAELLVGQPATVDFALSVGENKQVVDVSESTQTLNTVDATLGASIDSQTILALPSETRNVADLLSLQPGVLYLGSNLSTDPRNGAVNGGRSDQGNITLDGIDDNDQVYGYAFDGILRQTLDSVAEFRVTTGNGNADVGRSSGAQVSLITKSGTNTFHGSAYEYNRTTNTVSNDFFLKQAQAAEGAANRPPKLIRNIFGVSAGGPIFKNKLFFFANYEGERINESGVVTQTTPLANYKAGELTYVGDVLPVTTNPPVIDPTTQVLTAAQMTALDTVNGCSVCNTAAYPNPPGPNPNALAYFAKLPTANSLAAGDRYNTGGYVFSSPLPTTENTTIARLDYDLSSKHRVFVRGNLQKDISAAAIQFPGLPAATTTVDNTKGITFGDTWTISSNMVNDIRYGYVRQGAGTAGAGGTAEYVDFDGLSSPTSESRNVITSVPLNNIVDNLNITKGHHSLQMGVDWRLVHVNSSSNVNSFNSASTNPDWFATDPPQPSMLGGNVEPYDSATFLNTFLSAYANLVGAVPFVTDVYNYQLTSPTTGTLLPEGAPIVRHYSNNEYEGYIQDSWHATSALTVTFGLRYTNLQVPSETKGQELTPTISTDYWYKEREDAALQGQIYEPNLAFAPAGRYFHTPGFYTKQKDNFAPRVAVAYALNSKTSIRAGAGIYYDHFGESLINLYVSGGGGYGLSSNNQGSSTEYTVGTAPRYTDRNTLPFSNGAGAPTVSYPITPGPDFSITYGLDNKLKTPYTEAFDFSIQRQLPGGFTLETNYVGRMGRHLLQSIDLAEPVDYVDPQGAGDYYAAGTALSKITDANAQNAKATVQPIQYFEDVFPYMKNHDFAGQSATQAIYTDDWAPFRKTHGATTVLQVIDLPGSCSACPAGHQSRFWSEQFSSLYSLATVGMSYYDALQLTLHHPMSHGLQFDLNYSLSKSLDFGSDTERTTEYASNRHIVNTWKPYLDKGVSDFDTKQLLTLNWVDKLPFGKGEHFLGAAGPVTNAIIGGWQFAGIYRLSSGLPFTLYEGSFQTNYDFPGKAVETVKFKTHRTFIASNTTYQPQYFSNAAQITSGINTGTPVRLPYPGEAGERNSFRGDGYNDLDASLSKAWGLGRYGALKFSWEVYNVENIVRFDPESISAEVPGNSAALGTANAELSIPRRMQFALRYDF